MITQFRHACIQTDNRQRCPKCDHTEGGDIPISILGAFYQEGLGLKAVYSNEEKWKWGHNEVTIQIVKLAIPGQEETGPYLELVAGPWGAHVAFGIDEWPEDVTFSEPERLDGHDDGIEVGFAMDPAGNMIELVKGAK